MLRLLALFFLVYIFLRGVTMLMRTLMGRNNPQGDHPPNGRTKPKGGNVSIDYSPRDPRKKQEFKGGDYIDYEEVD